MRKIAFLLVLLIVLSSCITAYAVEPLGYAVYSDVVAYINHYVIPSYNFNGRTLVVAEDLVNYGFKLFWNEYSNTLSIRRDFDKFQINEMLYFRPSEIELGKNDIAITTSTVTVLIGGHLCTGFGGIEGKTLIDINDLACINNISVDWVPDIKAVKVWITDGLSMKQTPTPVRRWPNDTTYYDGCDGIHEWYHWQGYDLPNLFYLTLAETDPDGFCINTKGRLEITSVVDANGHQRLIRPVSLETNASMLPYKYSFTNYLMSHFVILKNSHLYPNTASAHGGLIKFTYTCLDCNSSISETLRVNCLPYED